MNSLYRFHREESGLSALQSVMIVSIAAIILVLLKIAWADIKNWFTIWVFYLIDFEGTDPLPQ